VEQNKKELKTERLLLNSFKDSDAELVAKMAGDKRVVKMTANIPYPYETSMAVSWSKSHQKQEIEDLNYVFAIRLKESLELVGCINLGLNQKHNRGVTGYWIGFDYWGKGYCTEALKEVVRFGFSEKGLNKIWAEHKTFNVASGRVMEKVGMVHEGIKRNHYKEDNDNYLDMSIKSILKSEYEGSL
jgi:RimJ/RimL family protein N-acetyltransferase